MNDQVVIRKAAVSDIEALSELLTMLFTIETDFTIDREKQSRGLEMLINMPDSAVVLTAENGGELIGMVTGQTVVSTAEGGISVRVEDMIVKPGYRRIGIGKKMIKELTKWAVGKNAARMELLADKTNASAYKFYKEIGWKETKMIAWHFKDLKKSFIPGQ